MPCLSRSIARLFCRHFLTRNKSLYLNYFQIFSARYLVAGMVCEINRALKWQNFGETCLTWWTFISIVHLSGIKWNKLVKNSVSWCRRNQYGRKGSFFDSYQVPCNFERPLRLQNGGHRRPRALSCSVSASSMGAGGTRAKEVTDLEQTGHAYEAFHAGVRVPM